MCTIMTMNLQTYLKNPTAVMERIKADARSNSDGFSLVLIGKKPGDQLIIRTLTLKPILDLIEHSEWERFFFHSRAATTMFRGLTECHGFQATNGWLVMHNGMISNPLSFRVDSEHIAHVVSSMGPRPAITWLSMNEHFANVMFVEPGTGRFYVFRSKGGRLTTNGEKDFSTNAIPEVGINQECGENLFWSDWVPVEKPALVPSHYMKARSHWTEYTPPIGIGGQSKAQRHKGIKDRDEAWNVERARRYYDDEMTEFEKKQFRKESKKTVADLEEEREKAQLRALGIGRVE